MTPLSKAVSRRTARPFMHYRRRLVVTLLPGDVLTIRMERERKSHAVSISVADLYRLLLRQFVTGALTSAPAKRAKASAAKRRRK
jgi:hypothetical protein